MLQIDATINKIVYYLIIITRVILLNGGRQINDVLQSKKRESLNRVPLGVFNSEHPSPAGPSDTRDLKLKSSSGG